MGDTTNIQPPDTLSSLKKFTQARIALGRQGVSLPSREMLQFKMDHAHARDAVFSLPDIDHLLSAVQAFKLPVYILRSRAADKHIYLKRPDLGRRLHQDSMNELNNAGETSYDVCITITDGLSGTAINRHAMQVLSLLIPALEACRFNIAPLCIVQHGRVAVADETASLLKAKLSVILIGERPGLSAHDSLGAYITYHPKPGLTDESRNCISNIRPEGLSYADAVNKIFYLISEAMRLQLSGVGLKEADMQTMALHNSAQLRG
ncbi:ethanolamine ammonia-lyase subunit EutC [Parafilimonas sp.]|uniref:ethanolamine ammonia-lyase subunit EutC n=1 Tax=Parafilimonas sp. TaxID=1969739 RepID=UPI0039E2369F